MKQMHIQNGIIQPLCPVSFVSTLCAPLDGNQDTTEAALLVLCTRFEVLAASHCCIYSSSSKYENGSGRGIQTEGAAWKKSKVIVMVRRIALSLTRGGLNSPEPHAAGLRSEHGAISVEIRLAVALRVLAGGSCMDVGLVFGVAFQTVYQILWEVIDAINSTPSVGPFTFPQTESDCRRQVDKWHVKIALLQNVWCACVVVPPAANKAGISKHRQTESTTPALFVMSNSRSSLSRGGGGGEGATGGKYEDLSHTSPFFSSFFFLLGEVEAASPRLVAGVATPCEWGPLAHPRTDGAFSRVRVQATVGMAPA